MSRWTKAVLLAGLLAALAWVAAGEARASQPAAVDEVTSQLVCPCAAGLSVADCQETLECPMAAKMEGLASELLTEGMNADEALDYFVETYGDSILISPQKEGFGLSAWAVPFAGVIAGVGLVAWLSWEWARRRRQAPAAEPAGVPPDLAAYRQRVERDLEALE